MGNCVFHYIKRRKTSGLWLTLFCKIIVQLLKWKKAAQEKKKILDLRSNLKTAFLYIYIYTSLHDFIQKYNFYALFRKARIRGNIYFL